MASLGYFWLSSRGSAKLSRAPATLPLRHRTSFQNVTDMCLGNAVVKRVHRCCPIGFRYVLQTGCGWPVFVFHILSIAPHLALFERGVN
jgi:hypothetical protein